MLVHVCKTRALLFENIYFKRIDFFFFKLKTEVAHWRPLERVQPTKIFIWPAWYVCLLFLI